MVEDAIAGPDQVLDAFLISNYVWGGAGSIADRTGVIGMRSAERRRNIEWALIQLGKIQIRVGLVNPWTAMWVR